MNDSHELERQIIRSWNANAKPWAKAIQAASIQSRNLVTDRASVDAVSSVGPGRVLDIGCGEGWLARAMRIWRWPLIGLCLSLGLSGCVIGYGPCLIQQPVKHNLTGHVHFRDYATSEGVDNVPVLALDRTAYVYAPAQSLHCLPANDVQLVGVAEFPRDVIENSHVSVDGVLFSAGSGRQHTPFVMKVNTILPIATAH